MLTNILKLNGAQELSKSDQKAINGGIGPLLCSGTGTGGHWTLGHSAACIGRNSGESCTINGYAAACTGIGDGFWFY